MDFVLERTISQEEIKNSIFFFFSFDTFASAFAPLVTEFFTYNSDDNWSISDLLLIIHPIQCCYAYKANLGLSGPQRKEASICASSTELLHIFF